MYATTLPPSQPDSRPADAPSATLDQHFDALTEARWHARALAGRLPSLRALSDRLSAARRTGWLHGLRQAWRRHGWALPLEGRLELLRLAAAWDDWPLVVGVGEALAAGGELPIADRLTLAHAWRRIGGGGSATDHATHLLLADPGRAEYLEEFAAIEQWRRFRDHFGLDDRQPDDGEGLLLEPLAHHHLEDFAWQYHDPAIADLCCLPHFKDDEHWHRWLDETYDYGDQLPFAVIHQEWGFIGVVSLILQQGVGFFYYWVGPDFQGHGLGPRAASLLLREANERWGLNSCYAKVFDYNTPSRKALEKMGFEALGIQAAPPDEREIFYRIGEAASHRETVEQLHTLLERMGSSTVAAAPLS